MAYRNIALQVLEEQRRSAVVTQWLSGCQWLRLVTVGMAETETARRAKIWRRFCLDCDLFALQRAELDGRNYAFSRVLGALGAFCHRFKEQMAHWREMERGRHAITHAYHCEWAQLQLWDCLQQQTLGRQELHGSSLGFLRYLYGCHALEVAETQRRRNLHVEQVAAFAVIQKWWGLMDGIERLFSAGRTVLTQLEDQERTDLYNSGKISQRMAKVSADLRLSQQSRDLRREATVIPALQRGNSLVRAATSFRFAPEARGQDVLDRKSHETTFVPPVLQRGHTVRLNRGPRNRLPPGRPELS
eukprot:EG_transcript_7856